MHFHGDKLGWEEDVGMCTHIPEHLAIYVQDKGSQPQIPPGRFELEIRKNFFMERITPRFRAPTEITPNHAPLPHSPIFPSLP